MWYTTFMTAKISINVSLVLAYPIFFISSKQYPIAVLDLYSAS